MKNTTNTAPLILASQSPRRSYLLEQAGLTFDVIPSAIDESRIPMGEPAAYARQQAEAKANDLAARHPKAWVIGADTIVVIDGAILGKPSSNENARDMLHKLSGQTHQVMTGFTICNQAQNFRFSDTVVTDVEFKKLAEAEIECIGTFLVRRIKGSYTNVVGLPVCEVLEVLIAESVVEYRR